MLRLLFATSECAPWIKTGGLGDVAAALPAALADVGVDVRVLLPAFPGVLKAAGKTRRLADVIAAAPWPAAVLRGTVLPSGVRAILVDCPQLYDRPGGPYQDARGLDHADNARRFGFFAWIAALLSGPTSPLKWRPTVLHCNDWQTGLAPAYLHFSGGARAATVMTVHNLAFQGVFAGNLTGELGLPPHAWVIDGVEFYGQTAFLKAGIQCADAISTVSPTYAREIQRSPLGFGLEGLLQFRADTLTGILNGIDTTIWNPATDALLPQRYDTDTLERKKRNKVALQHMLGLVEAEDVPLLGVVSRLTWQKGSDLVAALAPSLAARGVQLAVAGQGDDEHVRALVAASVAAPGQVAVAARFDEALAHCIEAGADAFLMPSRFEPCGLNQMYSQRYGTPPIAHATGGLVDSIVDATPRSLADRTATGFLFGEPSVEALTGAVVRMLDAYRAPDVWRAIQHAGMARDFGWRQSASAYVELYRRAAALAAAAPSA